MQYIVKFSGREPATYESDNGWRAYAEDGLCEYILDGVTGELLYERKCFYLIVESGDDKYKRPMMFPTYNKAFTYAMGKSGIRQFYISPVLPEEKGGD